MARAGHPLAHGSGLTQTRAAASFTKVAKIAMITKTNSSA